MKNKKRKKVNFPTKILLDYLKEKGEDLLDLSFKIFLDPDSLIRDAGFRVKYPSFSSSLVKLISRLDNAPTGSSFELKNDKIYLTEKGRIKLIKILIKEKRGKWDGRYRAIIFDIPEATRRERRFLRTELKQIGFKELQKSIWVYPYDIEKELLTLLKLWKIDFSGDIRFLRIDQIIDDKDIKKYFKLV